MQKINCGVPHYLESQCKKDSHSDHTTNFPCNYHQSTASFISVSSVASEQKKSTDLESAYHETVNVNAEALRCVHLQNNE